MRLQIICSTKMIGESTKKKSAASYLRLGICNFSKSFHLREYILLRSSASILRWLNQGSFFNLWRFCTTKRGPKLWPSQKMVFEQLKINPSNELMIKAKGRITLTNVSKNDVQTSLSRILNFYSNECASS